MTSISFTVQCEPVAQPRQKFRVVNMGGKMVPQAYKDSKHPVHDFKRLVARKASKAMEGRDILRGPLKLRIGFWMPRPKSLFWKTRPMPAIFHASKPDLDNLGKAVMDALSGITWADDRQISQLELRKDHCPGGAVPSVEIEIFELHEREANGDC